MKSGSVEFHLTGSLRDSENNNHANAVRRRSIISFLTVSSPIVAGMPLESIGIAQLRCFRDLP
jgi:hypothetical protein